MIYPHQRTAVFIDGTSMHRISRALEFDIDWALFRSYFEKKGTLTRLFYYSLTYIKENIDDKDDEEYRPIRPLLDWLDFNGFTVIDKPAFQFTNASGAKAWRGTLIPEIVVDMARMLPHVDHYILASGDGDLRAAVAYCQQNGKRVTVLATTKATGVYVQDSLRRQADEFMELDEIKNVIRKNGANAKIRP